MLGLVGSLSIFILGCAGESNGESVIGLGVGPAVVLTNPRASIVRGREFIAACELRIIPVVGPEIAGIRVGGLRGGLALTFENPRVCLRSGIDVDLGRPGIRPHDIEVVVTGKREPVGTLVRLGPRPRRWRPGTHVLGEPLGTRPERWRPSPDAELLGALTRPGPRRRRRPSTRMGTLLR